MSRSRRPRKRPKCICGRRLTPYLENGLGEECTTLHYVDERNEQFRKYRERRALPVVED